MNQPLPDGSTQVPTRRRWLRRWILAALGVVLILIIFAGWSFFHDLPLPVTARDRAMLVTVRDLEPWVPGLSASDGEETLSKRLVFFLGHGIHRESKFERLVKGSALSFLCHIYSEKTEAEAAQSYDTSCGLAAILGGLAGYAKHEWDVSGSKERIAQNYEPFLPDADASTAWTVWARDGLAISAAVVRKGTWVLSLVVIGPALNGEALRRVVTPRVDAMARAG